MGLEDLESSIVSLLRRCPLLWNWNWKCVYFVDDLETGGDRNLIRWRGIMNGVPNKGGRNGALTHLTVGSLNKYEVLNKSNIAFLCCVFEL
jgi:hypothetical protein